MRPFVETGRLLDERDVVWHWVTDMLRLDTFRGTCEDNDKFAADSHDN